RFFKKRPTRRRERAEGRTASSGVSRSQSQGRKCTQRLRSLAGAGETAESLARFWVGRREIQPLPSPNRTCRSSAAKSPRDRNGAIKSRTGRVCRGCEENRSQQVADRSFQANPKRTSYTAKSHPRCGQRSGQNSQIRLNQ